MNLPPSERWRLRHFIPFTRNEVTALLSSKETSIAFPPDMLRNSEGELDDRKLDQLQWYTGFLPGEMIALCKLESFEAFEKERNSLFKTRIENLFSRPELSNLQPLNNTFLVRSCFGRYGKFFTDLWSVGHWLDTDLFYRSVGSSFECISGLARNALRPYLSSALKEALVVPLNSIQDLNERSIALEKWVLLKLLKGDPIEISSFHVGTLTTSIPSKFTLQVDEFLLFDSTESIVANRPNGVPRRRLYVPVNRTYPAWDFLYDDGTTTAFFQISIHPTWKESDISIAASFNPSSSGPSQNSQILDRLRGINGHQVILFQREDPKQRYRTLKELVVSDPSGKNIAEHVVFYYGCIVPEENLKQDGGSSRRKPIYKFMRFFGAEELREKFGVLL